MMDDRHQMRQYLIQYAESGEVVNRFVKVRSKSDVLAASRAAFSLVGSFALEVYNKEYDLFVRTNNDDPDSLPDGGKLRLVRVRDENAVLTTSVSTADTIPVLSLAFSNPDGSTSILSGPSVGQNSS